MAVRDGGGVQMGESMGESFWVQILVEAIRIYECVKIYRTIHQK